MILMSKDNKWDNLIKAIDMFSDDFMEDYENRDKQKQIREEL